MGRGHPTPNLTLGVPLMSNIRSATALPGSIGWILALDFASDSPQWAPDADTPLDQGRYVAVLDRVDCEGCAAAVESAIQNIRGVALAGVQQNSSTLTFEVEGPASVHKADIEEELVAVGKALKRIISVASLRGPYPLLFSAA